MSRKISSVIELTYGAKIKRDGNGFLVTFRDIKNAFTGALTYEEAIYNAQEVLDLMLLDRLEKDEAVPTPSSIKRDEVPISASPDVAAPALLHILRTISHRSMSDVAKKWGFPIRVIKEWNQVKISP